MTTFLLTVVGLCWLADPSAGEPRRFHEIDRELSAALRQEATAATPDQRAAAVREIARLFTELDRDPRLLTSPGLQDFRARARGRLVTVRTQLLREIARAEQDARKQRPDQPLTVGQTTLLAAAAEADQRALAAHLAAEVSLANRALGGPAQLFDAAGAARGGGAIADHGEDLVDLITRTIFPDKWEVNGGPCTIVYYRPLMCLVVTATGDVHRDAARLLDALR